MTGCSAPNCRNQSNTKRMFRFPKNETRRQQWEENCRRKKWVPNANSRLCEDHFEKGEFEYMQADGRRRLRKDAVPTLFRVSNPPPMRNREPRSIENVQRERMFIDHMYCQPPCPESTEENSENVPTKIPRRLTGHVTDPHVSSILRTCLQSTESDVPSMLAEQSSLSSPLHTPSQDFEVSRVPPNTALQCIESSTCIPATSAQQSSLSPTSLQPNEAPSFLLMPAQESHVSSVPFILLCNISSSPHEQSTVPTYPPVSVQPDEASSILSTSSQQPDVSIPPQKSTQEPVTAKDKELLNMRRKLQQTKQKLWRVQRELAQQRKINKNIKESLTFLRPDQLDALSKRKATTWSEDTLRASYLLRLTCGRRGYDSLIRQGYPLPSYRTLCRRAEHFQNGVVSEFMVQLNESAEAFSEKERECVISIDEVHIESEVGTSQTQESFYFIPTESQSS